ncbi:hypothetical protein FRC11_008961 [Ceratobasidium sp. 423]|nr:hypothetical protein FRC11_008961 [Ceratobasidium sp. 423]
MDQPNGQAPGQLNQLFAQGEPPEGDAGVVGPDQNVPLQDAPANPQPIVPPAPPLPGPVPIQQAPLLKSLYGHLEQAGNQ